MRGDPPQHQHRSKMENSGPRSLPDKRFSLVRQAIRWAIRLMLPIAMQSGGKPRYVLPPLINLSPDTSKNKYQYALRCSCRKRPLKLSILALSVALP